MVLLKILHILGSLGCGGAESRTMDIYRNINRGNIQFDFTTNSSLCEYFEPEIKSMGGNVYRGMPSFSFFNYVSYKKSWSEFFKLHKYDIIHIHTTNSAVPIALAAKENGVKTIIAHSRQASESSCLRKTFAFLQRKFLCMVTTDRLAVSNAAGKFVFGSSNKFTSIPNAIDVSKYAYSNECRLNIRTNMNLGDCPVIVMVGRLENIKNHIFLIEAFSILLKYKPNTILLIAGEGSYRSKIENKIDILKIIDNVKLLGLQKNISDILQASDLFVMPSIFEGFPGAALEAQAAGLPCLLSKHITRECLLLKDRVEYLDINSPQLWADKMYEYLELKSLSRDTTKKICDSGFDIASISKWYEEFYFSKI